MCFLLIPMNPEHLPKVMVLHGVGLDSLLLTDATDAAYLRKFSYSFWIFIWMEKQLNLYVGFISNVLFFPMVA